MQKLLILACGAFSSDTMNDVFRIPTFKLCNITPIGVHRELQKTTLFDGGQEIEEMEKKLFINDEINMSHCIRRCVWLFQQLIIQLL